MSVPGRVFNYFGDEDSKTLYLLADNNQPTENEKHKFGIPVRIMLVSEIIIGKIQKKMKN